MQDLRPGSGDGRVERKVTLSEKEFARLLRLEHRHIVHRNGYAPSEYTLEKIFGIPCHFYSLAIFPDHGKPDTFRDLLHESVLLQAFHVG
jgi:hypothetical protein